MKTIRTTQELRGSMNNKEITLTNGRVPVIATIYVSARKQDIGVQFWTKEDLTKGFVINGDGKKSNFVELY